MRIKGAFPVRWAAQDGNGITSDRFYFLLTEMPSIPSASDSGWIDQGTSGCPTSGTESKPYLWKKESITYSKTASQNIISLVSVFGLSQRPQLLEQTAFDGDMDKWDIKNGTVVPLAKGEINGFGLVPSSGSTYQEILDQRVLEPAKFCKLEPNEYYTLSFFARDRKYVNLTDNQYKFGTEQIYLRAGNYRLQVNGHCSAEAKAANIKLSAFLYMVNPDDTWLRSVRCDITVTNDVTSTTPVLTIPESGIYTIRFCCYKSEQVGGSSTQTVTVNWWRIICDTNNNEFSTYLFPADSATNALLMPSTWFVDGVAVNKTGTYTDGCVNWNLANDKQDSQGWAFHSVTFKTKSPIPESVVQHLRFRNLLNCYVEICMPKLEKSIMATSWCRNENDSNGECSHNPCGKWVQGAIYYYCNGQRDVVRAPKTSSSNEETWWRMRRRTTSSGYVSNTQPYADTAHWESANNLKFTVVDAMFAQEIFTDKLIVSNVRSGVIHVKSLYTQLGQLKQTGGRYYLDLDGEGTGNTYVIPGNTNVYLPPADDYEGLSITILFNDKSGLSCDIQDVPQGILCAYFVTNTLNVKPSLNSMSVRCFICFSDNIRSLTSLTLQALRPGGPNDAVVRWVVIGQRGLLRISNYYSSQDENFACLFPDGRLVS